MPQSVALELLTAFETEALLYERLFEILQRERQAIVDGESQLLAEIVQEENEQIRQIQRLESERDELLVRAYEELDLPEGPLKLDLLKPHVPEPAWERIDRLVSRLDQLHPELKRVNDQITHLVTNVLEYTRFCLGLFAEAQSDRASYGRTGKRTQASASAFLNREL